MDQFRLIRDFSRELTSTLELGELANVINDFAVVHLGAAHSSIALNGRKYSYSNESRPVLDGIEAETLKYAMKVRKALRVANPRSEFMFKAIQDIDLFDKSLFSIPLVTKGKVLGCLNLYFGSIPGDELSDFLELFAELSASSIMNSLSYMTMEEKSMTDKLTGISNRASFDSEIREVIGKCAEAGKQTSVMMVDIDNFKDYNDKHGHQKGDNILQKIGNEIGSFSSCNLKAFRYGGEEIAVVASGMKPEEAFEKAEQIRKKVEESGTVTISIGLATCLNSSCSAEKMVSEADKALYKAKKAGKNRTHSSVIIDNGLSPIDVQAASELGKP
jgi:diguanylate cyclase (GGDEF)-like protein